MDTALPATRTRIASVSGNVMYPFDLKNTGATRAEMLALKNNDAGECVCLL